MLTPREKLVLDCIRSDPMASQDAIAARLGISRSAVGVHVMNLSAKGAIRGRAYVLNEAPYVVAIGGATVDISGRPDAALRPGDSNPGRVTMSAGGVARNVAENLTRLDIDCRLVSVIGDDSHGDFLTTATKSAGLDTSGLVRLPGHRTATYLSIVGNSGELEAGISDMDIMDHLGMSVLQDHDASLRNASALFIDANLNDKALRYVFENFSDKTIIADPVSVAKAPRLRPFLQEIDILKPTLSEAGTLVGKRIRSRRQAGSVARALLGSGVKQVFVSLGAQGVFAADADTALLVAAEPAGSVASVTGAGDALVAGLIVAHLGRSTTVEMAEFSNRVASIALESGNASPSASALRELVKTTRWKEDHHA